MIISSQRKRTVFSECFQPFLTSGEMACCLKSDLPSCLHAKEGKVHATLSVNDVGLYPSSMMFSVKW